MPRRLLELVERWCDLVGVESSRRPSPSVISASFPWDAETCRPPADASEIVGWELRHGYQLPEGLKSWLSLSDGFFSNAPLIHPISAIGPMVPFARVPGLVVQPESWFELGNPNRETVCIDLGYRGPSDGSPVFTSGDDEQGSRPRIIAPSFDTWFLRLLVEGGREYWFDPASADFGDPWLEHRRHVPRPKLPSKLAPLADRLAPLILGGADDRVIATRFGISPFEVEAITRHVQHTRPVDARSSAARTG
jgi:hypothetical protein